jgi:hypothetical protein
MSEKYTSEEVNYELGSSDQQGLTDYAQNMITCTKGLIFSL